MSNGIKTIIIFCLMALAMSCTKNRTSKVEGNENVEVETPKALLKDEINTSDILTSNYSKYRNYRDVVNELFLEACKNDIELNDLYNTIDSEISNAQEKVNELNEYSKVIERVYLNARSHTNSINNDSILILELNAFSVKNEDDFDYKLKPYQSEAGKITRNKVKLENKLVELKIKVALRMMKGFQDNEVPELEALSKMNSILIDLQNKMDIQINKNK